MSHEARGLIAKLEQNVGKVVLGKPEVIRLGAVALLAGEHMLIEDVPGVGKTLLAKAFARSIEAKFSRIQFTPDLLPSDIIGSSIFQSQRSEFVFNPGPIFSNIVLADEINRTTPRTQSALLEAMSDNQVSVDGHTHPLPRPFLVFATQNPFEFEGTYPLLESQLDRFLLRTQIGYADRTSERQALRDHLAGQPVDQLPAVLTCDEVQRLQQQARKVRVGEEIQEYLLDIVEATRNNSELLVGVSTRAAIGLHHAAQAHALIDGRDFVIPDDVKRLAVAVFSHRVIAKGLLHGGQRHAVEAIIRRALDGVRVPT